MRIEEWENRYRNAERPAEDLHAAPTPLLIRTATPIPPGAALDLACGTGRNALWLAAQGWEVTAVDGSRSAIDILNERASRGELKIRATVADLERLDFVVQADSWDLIIVCYYLQRSLIPVIRRGIRPGGMALIIAHITGPGQEVSYKRASPGELRAFFPDWEVLHYFEGRPDDPTHHREVAELVARKPF